MKLALPKKLKTEEGKEMLRFKILGDINPSKDPGMLVCSDLKEKFIAFE